MEKDRPDAVIVQPSLPSKRAAELALKHHVPAVSVPRRCTNATLGNVRISVGYEGTADAGPGGGLENLGADPTPTAAAADLC
jgi:hypothetical protein